MSTNKDKIARQLERLSILVVEDNRFFRSLIRTVLREFGIKNIAEVEDGAEAMTQINASPPDIVLLDWYMPLFSGVDFMRAFNETKHPGRIMPAVIVLTSNATKKNVTEAARLGVDGILCKPIVPALIYQRIVEVMPEKRFERVFAENPSQEISELAPLSSVLSSTKSQDVTDEEVFLI